MTRKQKREQTKKAAGEVSRILRQITSGPRFDGHLNRIMEAYRLSGFLKTGVMKRGFRMFLGYK